METPIIKYGFRGEDIECAVRGKSALITFTWCKGDRVYTDSIKRWKDTDEIISQEDKVIILKDVIAFINKSRGRKSWWLWRKRIMVVINSDDPDKELWENICKKRLDIKIEYTSNQGQKNFEREMYLGVLRAGKKLTINTTEIKSEKELDDFLRQRDLEK